MNPADFLSLFLIGFLGGGHCVAMCGGLSSAFALQLPEELSRLKLIILLNLGRVCSYMTIGAILGTLGEFGLSLDKTHTLQIILLYGANILLIFMGLYLAGLSSFITKVEHLGTPIWKKLNPLLQKLLPLKSAKAAFLVGTLWGWLPCGLVYSASIYALGSGSLIKGALLMLAFAIGTLPNLLALGVFATQLKILLQKRFIRILAGLLIIMLALSQLSHAFIALL